MSFALQAFAAEESIIDLKYERHNNKDTKSSSVSTSQECSISVAASQDVRLNKETLGTTFRDNPIMSKQPATDWLHNALLDMKKLGINTNEDGQTPDAPVLTTELEKLYIWNHSMNLYATIVVKAFLKKGDQTLIDHKYRVIGTKLNWVNGDGEFVTTLNIAVGRLLDQLAADVAAKCNS